MREVWDFYLVMLWEEHMCQIGRVPRSHQPFSIEKPKYKGFLVPLQDSELWQDEERAQRDPEDLGTAGR